MRFVKPYKKWFYQGLALTTLGTVISLVPPILMGVIVDQVIGQRRDDLFWPVLIAYILIPLIANGIGLFNNLIISLIGDKLVLDMRKQLYEHLQYLPMRYYDKSSTGAVMERLMGDVAQVNQMVSGQTIAMVTDVVASSVALVVMLNLNWRMTCLLMLVLPLYIVNFKYFSEKVRIWREAFREKIEDMSSAVQERLAGTAAIKAFGQEKNETRRFIVDAGEARVANLKAHFSSVAFGSTSSLIYWLGQTGIYLMGCYLVIRSEMTLGEVIAFTSYCVYLLQPALRFSNISATVERSMVSVRRVFELLDEKREPADPADAVEAQQLRGDVRFENVRFEYDPGVPVIREFTLDVPSGSTVALVGHTGCGKTTMISLLMRFYRPVEGRIVVDGVGLNDYSRQTLRRNISLVPQDPVLFEGTVRDNICYGRREASLDQVIAAAKAAEIHKSIMELPDGYDTMLGEEGSKLSVGQKQRLVIARAILADPAILILDEATSALDTESERLLQKALDHIMQNRTSFVIAHRLSTIVGADMIVMMSEGKILEVGRHHELLAKKDGHYRQLYFTQFAKVA